MTMMRVFSFIFFGLALCTFPFQMYPEQLLSRINEVRRQNGFSQLAIAPELNRSAQEHSDYQASMNQVVRTGPIAPLQRVLNAGFQSVSAAAAVTFTSDTSYQRAMEQMLDRTADPLNYEAIVGRLFTHVGFGAAVKGNSVYWTFHFAEKQPPQSSPTAQPTSSSTQPLPTPSTSIAQPLTPIAKPSVIPVVNADTPAPPKAVPAPAPSSPCASCCSCCEKKDPDVILAVVKPRPILTPFQDKTVIISDSPNLLAPKRIIEPVALANPIFADNPTSPMLPRQEFAYPAGYPSVPAPRPIGHDSKGQPIFIQ